MKKHYDVPSAGALKVVTLSELMPIICDRLYAGQSVELMPHGVSMLPTIRDGRDSVILTAVSGRLKKYDVALYMRESGEYVLHRVIRVGESDYTFIGDSQFVEEPGITDLQLLARVAAYKRGSRIMYVDSPRAVLSARLICLTRPIRRFLKRVKRRLYRTYSRLKKRIKR